MLAILAAGFLFYVQPPAAARGDAQARVEFRARGEVDARCIALGAPNEPGIAACARGRFIVLPNPCDWPLREAYAELACHELGHVNGWRHAADPRFGAPR